MCVLLASYQERKPCSRSNQREASSTASTPASGQRSKPGKISVRQCGSFKARKTRQLLSKPVQTFTPQTVVFFFAK